MTCSHPFESWAAVSLSNTSRTKGRAFSAYFLDCAGDTNGSNVVDNCGVCDSDSSNDCVQSCDGQWGTGVTLDECNVCGGLCTDSATTPCDGNWGGTGPECSAADCAGVPNGNNLVDNCGDCDSDSSNDCIEDCAGNAGGPDGDPSTNDDLVYDACGVCDGLATGPGTGDMDCASVCSGGLIYDECG